MQYTFKGQPVELLQIVLEDHEWQGDEQDFCPYVCVRLENGEIDTMYCHSISPNPERVLLEALGK